jgi:hypothetical protein
MSPIGNIAGNFISSLFDMKPQNTGNHAASGTGDTQKADGNQPSLFAQMVSTLQQIQQSGSSQYQQVTKRIAVNLETASQSAASRGNATQASTLDQLSKDFASASQNGQLPDFSKLAQAVHSHHHFHHAHSVADLLAAVQPAGTQASSLNPMGIIQDTLVPGAGSTSLT